MIDTRKLGKILTLAIVVFAVGIVLMIAAIVLRTIYPVTWQQTKPIGYNIYAPKVVDDTTINYYTGNTFASLNTKTGERKPLTDKYVLPDLQNIHWLAHGVVFTSPTINDYSDIAAYGREHQKESEGILYDSNTPTSWYLSFTNNSLTLLNNVAYASPETSMISTSDGGLLFKIDDTRFSMVTPDGEVKQEVFNVSGDTRPVYATSKELYYLETDLKTNNTNLKKVSAGSNTSTDVYKNLYTLDQGTIVSNIVTRDGVHYYYVFHDNPETQSVRSLDVSNSRVATIMDHFVGTLTADPSGVIATALRNNYDELSLIDTSNSIQTVRVASLHNQASQRPSAYFLGDNVLFSTSDGVSTILGASSPSGVTTAKNEAFDKKITPTDTYALDRNIEDFSDQSYSLTIYSGRYGDTVTALKSRLSDQGISPYEIEVSLSPGMQVEF